LFAFLFLSIDRERKFVYTKDTNKRSGSDDMNTTLKRRRRKEHTSKKLIIGILIAAVLLLYLLNVGISSTNIQGSVQVENKGYILLEINQNDTLWGIAESYMNDKFYTHESYIAEIIEMNHLDSSTIIAGEALLIPIILN
jgi:hypothetical protein